MQKYSRDNKGYKYILTMIDCFSKKGWAVPVEDKSGILVTIAIELMLPKKNVTHKQSDQGLHSLISIFLF